MSRSSRTRAVVATGLTLGTATAGLLFAPAAFAAEFTATGPASVVAGTPFTLTGAGCTTADESDPAVVVAVTDADAGLKDVLFATEPDADGTWSVQVSYPANTTPGDHEISVTCGTKYTEEPTDEAVVDLKITAPAATTTTPSPTAAAPSSTAAEEFKPGAKANTPGTGSVTTSKTTGNAAAPGQKVVKVIKGFKPNEKVTLVLHSTPVTLGEFQADANGVVTAEFTVPAGTPLGQHTLAFKGADGSYFEAPLTLTADGKALAYTGADIKLPLVGGTVLLAAGAGALVVGRRRRTTGAVQA